MIRFVIPAYNEAENVPRLLADLAPRARALGARVIIVDDGSSDGTGDAVRARAEDMHLAVVRHPVNAGLGAAINTGIRAALSEASDDDAIVTLEADTTSDLEDLPTMLAEFERGADVVLASVYAPGGALLGVSKPRIALSKSVSTAFRYAGGLSQLHTLSSLYRVYRAGTLRSAAETYGYLLVREPGFAANVELLLKLYAAGARFAEVPTTNDWSTRKGSSKMRLRPTATAYFRVMLAHLAGRIQPPPISPLADAKRAAARRALPPGPLEAARPRALEAPAQAVPAASDR
jgi:dolichol-phosphate mannosyltransferase